MIFGKAPANKTSSSNLPWLASIATCLQWISLILTTLIFVCPSPWEHNSISLFVISPVQQQQQQQPSITSSSVTTLPSQNTVMTSSDSTSSTPSSSSSLPNRYPAIQTAVTQSGTTNTKREPIENAPYQINEVLPNSSLPVNITALNTTTTTTSLIQLRIGVLGSCFRTREGHESCTPAKLTAIYQYKGLQSVINSTSSINVEEILPDNMTFYATILLFLIVLLLCVCIFTSVHIFLFFRQNKQIQQSMSASQAITTFFQPTSTLHSITTIISKFLTAIIALVLVVSSAIQKYKLSNTKNSFNSANPIMNDSMTTLQADTGNAFGFAWISTLFLIIAFWLQRTANRRENALRNARKEIQKSLPHFKQDSQQQQQQQQTMMMNNLSRSATLPPYTPPPQQQKEQGYDLKRTGNQSEFDSSSFINGLPSLQKAYESIGRFNAAKSSPPFSTYQNEFGQRQQQQHGSPLRHMNTIHHSPSSSTRSQQPQIDYYEQSNFGNNTFDQADHSYNTEFLADEPTTCDCSYGRNRLDCSYNSTSTDDNSSFCNNNNNQNRNRRSFQILKRQNSHSTFGHHHHHHKNPGSHRLGQDFNNNNRSISPAPSYWTSSSAPPGLQSSSSNTILQQEWARQEKERQRLFMAELRAQRAAMHSR